MVILDGHDLDGFDLCPVKAPVLLFRHGILVYLKDQPKGLPHIDSELPLPVALELVAPQLRQLSGHGQVGHGAELVQPLGDPFGIVRAVRVNQFGFVVTSFGELSILKTYIHSHPECQSFS